MTTPQSAYQMRLPDGRTVWIVEEYDLARQTLTDSRLSNDTARMGLMAPLAALPDEVKDAVSSDMLNTDPPRHTQLRALLAHTFTGRRVSSARPMIERVASTLLDELSDGAVVDLVERFAGPLPTAVLAELIGIPTQDCADVRRWSDTFVSELLLVSDTLLAATTSLLDYALDLVRRRRAEPRDDLVTRLLSSGVDDDVLSSIVFVLLIAGQTATTQLIAKGSYLLLAHQDQLDKVRADPTLIAGAVDECLRHEPPLQVSAFRMATTDLVLGDTVIPAGDVVLCSLASANRDEARFTEAQRFDVCRPDNQHLAFGHGIHRCLGANLAKLEAEVAFSALLTRFDVEVAVPARELRWAQVGIMRKITALPVQLTSR